MKIRSFQSVLFISVLLTSSGCGILCRVKIKNEESSRTEWFDSLPLKDSNTFWARFENYSGKSAYIENIDTSILDSCKECQQIQSDFIRMFNTSKIDFWPEKSKSLTLSKNRESADYTIFIKIVSIKEAPAFAKYISPLGDSVTTFRYWAKIKNNNNNKIIFVYSSLGLGSSQKEFNNTMTSLINAVDNYSKNSYSGI